MTDVTWIAVASVSNTFLDAEGYVSNDYVVDDYVAGIEPTPDTWTAASNASTTWSAA